MEDECHQLNQEINLPTESTSQTSSAFQQYHQARATITSLTEEKAALSNEIDQAQELLILLMLTIPDPMQSIVDNRVG